MNNAIKYFLVKTIFFFVSIVEINATLENQSKIVDAKNQIKNFLQNAVDSGTAEKFPECPTINLLKEFYEIRNKEGEVWRLAPLDVALEFDNAELLKQLLEKKIDRIVLISKPMLLMIAIDREKTNCARTLIESGDIDINMPDPHGRTPLTFAAYKNYEITKLLLEKGANQDLKDTAGKTAKDYALASNNNKIKDLFVLKEDKKELSQS